MISVSGKNWKQKKTNKNSVEKLKQDYGFSEIVSQLVTTRKFDDIAVIPSFVLAPLTYLGGVFYTVSLLPEFWQNISRLNPILYMINSMRYSVIGISDVSIQNALMMIVVFFVVLFSIAVILLRKGIGIRQ